MASCLKDSLTLSGLCQVFHIGNLVMGQIVFQALAAQ